jgi:hypothetical protein
VLLHNVTFGSPAYASPIGGLLRVNLQHTSPVMAARIPTAISTRRVLAFWRVTRDPQR